MTRAKRQHLTWAALAAGVLGISGGLKAFTDWAIDTNSKISTTASSQARYIQTVNALVQQTRENTQEIARLKRKAGLRVHARPDTLMAVEAQPQEGLVRKFIHLLF